MWMLIDGVSQEQTGTQPERGLLLFQLQLAMELFVDRQTDSTVMERGRVLCNICQLVHRGSAVAAGELNIDTEEEEECCLTGCSIDGV